MKKKNLNIILIPGVLCIWAIIIIKVFSYSKTPKIETLDLSVNSVKPERVSILDTIVIYANYRDPFIDSHPAHISGNTTMKLQIEPIQKPLIIKVSWPVIIYGGLVKNAKVDKELGLVIISGSSNILEKNMEITGVRILDIFSDSIIVQYQKEIKTIVKK